MKRILSALAGLLLASAAVADTHYWLSPLGNDANDGLSDSAPWATMAHANATVVAPSTANGRVVLHLVAGGGPWALFSPANVAIEGKYFEVVGDTTAAGPWFTGSQIASYEMAGPAGMTLSKANVVFRGVTFSCGYNTVLTLTSGARGVRIRDCRFQNVNQLVIDRATDVSIRRCDLGFERIHVGLDSLGVSWPAFSPTKRDTIESCRALALGASMSQYAWPAAGLHLAGVDSCLFLFNTFKIELPNATSFGNERSVRLERSRFNRFYANKFVLMGQPVSSTWGQRGKFEVGNYSSYNVWKRDSLLSYGPGSKAPAMTSFMGSADSMGSARCQVVDSCFFYSPMFAAVSFEGGMDSLTITRNVFASTVAALEWKYPGTYYRANIIDHNTFIGDGRGGIVNLDGATPGLVDFSDMRMSNNLYHANSPSPGSACFLTDAHGLWQPYVCVRTSEAMDSTHTTLYRNLFAHSTLDRAYGWWASVGARCTSADTLSQDVDLFPARDSVSVATLDAGMIAPAVGSTYDSGWVPVGFDPRLMASSPARGIGSSGTDAGALSFASTKTLQVVRADSTLAAEVPPGTAGTMEFWFKSTGTDTVSVDTMFVWHSFGSWDPAHAGSVTYNGLTQGKIPPGQTMVVTVSFVSPPGSVSYVDPQPVAPYIDGLVFDTDAVGYNCFTDPYADGIHDPAQCAVGFMFSWPYAGTTPVISHQ